MTLHVFDLQIDIKQELENDKLITQEIKSSKSTPLNRSQFNLIFFGNEYSGKETVYKQLHLSSNHGYSQPEKEMFRSKIIQLIYQIFFQVMNEMKYHQDLYQEIDPDLKDLSIAMTMMPLESFISNFEDKVFLESLKSLWNDEKVVDFVKGINKNLHVNLNLSDCQLFFMENLKKYGDKEYMMSDQDVLYCDDFVGNHEIDVYKNYVESTIEMDSCFFKLLLWKDDMDKCPRKMLHTFMDFDLLVFCLNLSEYNIWIEGSEISKFERAIVDMNGLLENEYLNRRPVLAFFTHSDLFKEKNVNDSVLNYYPDYNDNHYFKDDQMEVLKNVLLERYIGNGTIYCFETSIYDTEQMRNIWDTVRDSVLFAQFDAAAL